MSPFFLSRHLQDDVEIVELYIAFQHLPNYNLIKITNTEC